MKKNNKGFFLAETIVVIALVTTVMAFVYPNVSNLYSNYVNRTKYYDQTEDLYALRAIDEYFMDNDIYKTLTSEADGSNYGCKDYVTDNNKMVDLDNVIFDEDESIYDKVRNNYVTNLSGLYFTSYMATPSINSDYNFNKYLKRLKKTTYDAESYRLIGKFSVGSGSDTRFTYASIKIDNPNPNRGCTFE